MDYFDAKMKNPDRLKPFVQQKGTQQLNISIHGISPLISSSFLLLYHLSVQFLSSVFGYPLYALILRERHKTGIPSMLEKTTKFILDHLQEDANPNDNNSNPKKTTSVEGIFRVPPNVTEVNELKEAFDQGN